jgi:exodeoxyribonuclease V gamma subunit
VRERFSLSEDDLADLRELVVSSGLRWAWDADDRARHGQPALIQNTVRFAIERLAMGVLMPEPGPLEVVQGVVPLPVHSRDRVARFGKLATICRALEGTRELLSSAATTTEWRARLVAVIERFTPVGPSRIAVVERLEAALPDQPDKADEPDEPDTLMFEREAVQRVVEGAFEDRARGDRPVTGAVTVCALEPMRSVPFRVIALLGMDDGVFPRSPKMRSWDPFAERRPGELDRRAVDRHLVLEALLSARDRLMVLWTGFEPKRGQAQPACVVVEELLDVVARLTGKTRDALVTNHPLQPWSTRSFVGERPSYDAIMASAASALVGPRSSTGLWNEAGEVNALGDEVPAEISAEALARALAEPQRHLLKDRLGLELDPREVEVLDREPIELDALDQWKVRDPIVRRLVASEDAMDEDAMRAVERSSIERLSGEGLLPLAHAGRRVVKETVREASELRELWLEAKGRREPGRLVAVELTVDDQICTVTGRAPRWLRDGDMVWLEWTLGSKLGSKHKLIAWVEVLVAKLVHPEVAGARIVAWRADKKAGASPVEAMRIVAPEPEDCRERLATLLAVWRELRRRRVALFPKLSSAIGKGNWKLDEIVEKGRSYWAEDQEDLWVASLWGELELGDLHRAHGTELVDLAEKVWKYVHGAAGKEEATNRGAAQ